MIIEATYTSVWASGLSLKSPCKYDPVTLRCFDIEPSNVLPTNQDLLLEERVSIYFEKLGGWCSFDKTNGVIFDY